MNSSYLSLGSNIGNRLSFLQQAVQQLSVHPAVEVQRMSSIYETDPVGYTDQASFLNLVLHFETRLSPQALLSLCQEIEQDLQRKRVIRWGPRTIDLDILLYNQDNMKTDSLTVPHPRMYERAFVLVPLLELEPGLIDPASGQPFKNFEAADQGIRLWKTFNDIQSFIRDENSNPTEI